MSQRTRAVYAVTLGCPKNRVDTEYMLGDLVANGWKIALRPKDADVLLVNTCGFLKDARRESIAVLQRLLRQARKGARVVATGCMASLFRQEIEEALPEVLVFASGRKTPLDFVAGQACGGQGLRRLVTTGSHTAYLKIAEGCSRQCTFCIIPAIRGRQRSRPANEVIAEARTLAECGVKELVLVAQDLTRWGRDLPGQPGLPDLVRQLSEELPQVRWIRLMYLYPSGVTEGLLQAVSDAPNVLSYLDIPVQHADDRVLAAMRRGTRAKDLLATVARVRAALPDCVLRTTYMVGFPGETEDAFLRLVAFAKAARFEMAGVFCFSPEPFARAASLPNQVPGRVAQERMARLQSVLDEVASEHRMKQMGQVHEAVVEARRGRDAVGRLWFQAPEVDGVVVIRGFGGLPGEFVKVVLTGAEGSDFVARAVE